MEIILVVSFSYLSGSIPFGLILTKFFGGQDIRKIGSGNIGATNVLRTGNKFLAALTLVLDILKGYMPVIISLQYFPELIQLSCLLAFLGHIFPVWLKFNGGKGVATYLGILLALSIQLGLLFIFTWMVVSLIFKYSSVSSMFASLTVFIIHTIREIVGPIFRIMSLSDSDELLDSPIERYVDTKSSSTLEVTTDEYIQPQLMYKTFGKNEITPNVREWDDNQIFPIEVFKKLGKLGLMGVLVPTEYGGSGFSYTEYVTAIEELSILDPSIGLSMAAHNSLCTGHILQFGSEEQKNKWLPKLVTAEWIGAWGLTEHNTGSDVGGMRTTATKDGEYWVLNGSKNFITHAISGDIAVVLARTTEKGESHGITSFVIEKFILLSSLIGSFVWSFPKRKFIQFLPTIKRQINKNNII